MKVVLLSDLHFKLGNIPDIYINDYEGVYYPTQNLLLAAEIAKKEGADAIFILGDVFDRTSNSHFLVDCIGRIFEIVNNVCPVFILLGNHDIEVKNKELKEFYSTLRVYKEVVKIVESPYVDTSEKIVMLPYNSQEEIYYALQNGWKDYLLFTHIGVNGVEMTKGLFSKREPFNLENLSVFRKVISGHYHLHSINKNVYYLGSPWTVRANELGEDKFIHVLDTESLEVKKYKSIYSEVKEVEVNSIDDIRKDELDRLFRENVHLKVKLIVSEPTLIAVIDSIVKDFGYNRVLYTLKDTKFFTASDDNNSKTSVLFEKTLTVESLMNEFIPESKREFVEATIKDAKKLIESFSTKNN